MLCCSHTSGLMTRFMSRFSCSCDSLEYVKDVHMVIGLFAVCALVSRQNTARTPEIYPMHAQRTYVVKGGTCSYCQNRLFVALLSQSMCNVTALLLNVCNADDWPIPGTGEKPGERIVGGA